jgi:pimeloyl-ACP methyl ester carboxylesterase
MSVFDFPAEFRTRDVATNGTLIHLRAGGAGPAVVLLHGYGDTGDMWVPLASDLARDHTVVVPDLRGSGLSSKPPDGFDKKTQAGDVAGVLDALQIDRADLVTHDIGNMVGYAFAAQYPERVRRFVLIDAPLPGIGPWEDILKNPLLWHFRFGGPDMERLVAGRERIYLDRFWNEFQRTLRVLAKRRARTMPSFTPCRALCIPASCNSPPSTRTLSTINNSWPKASLRCRCWQSGAKNRLRDHGKDHAICSQ